MAYNEIALKYIYGKKNTSLEIAMKSQKSYNCWEGPENLLKVDIKSCYNGIIIKSHSIYTKKIHQLVEERVEIEEP